MEIPNIPNIRLKPLPFFKDGTLVFNESGHALRISDRHYRCDLNCRGKCKLPERQIKTQNLEKNFLTLLNKFEIDADTTDKVLDRLVRDNLVDIILGPEKESRVYEGIMDTTLSVAAQDLQKKGKVKRQDLKDFEDAFLQKRQTDYSMLLAGITFDVLRAINPNAQEKSNRGKTFARIVKHLFISNDGKILKIEFEPWGWYIIRLIDKKVLGYLDGIRKKHVHIINESKELDGKKLSEADFYFAAVKPNEALGQNINASKEWITLISDMMKSLLKNDVQGAQKAQLVLLGMMQNFPIAEMLAGIAPALEQKPKFK